MCRVIAAKATWGGSYLVVVPSPLSHVYALIYMDRLCKRDSFLLREGYTIFAEVCTLWGSSHWPMVGCSFDPLSLVGSIIVLIDRSPCRIDGAGNYPFCPVIHILDCVIRWFLL